MDMNVNDRLYFDPDACRDVWEEIKKDETLVLRVVASYVFKIPTPTTEANKLERSARLAQALELLGFDVTQGEVHLDGDDVTLSRWRFDLRDGLPSDEVEVS